MDTIVGERHGALVAALVQSFDDVTRQRLPRLVVLEGPQGYGKTRVVWSFYELLAARQGEPRYWPPSIISTDQDALVWRKAIYPMRFMRRAGALPDFLWWGVTCHRQGDAFSFLEDMAQISVHRQGLAAQWLRSQRRRVRLLTRIREKLRESLRRNSVPEVVGLGLSVLSNTTIPFLGLAVDLATDAVGAARARAETMSRASSDEFLDVSTERRKLVADIALELVEFARRGLPVVVAIEDAHLADAQLVELVSILIRQQEAPILVVATAWPSGTVGDTAFASLLRNLPRGTTLVQTVELPELDEACKLVRAHAPQTPEEIVVAVAKHLRSPLLINEAFGTPSYRRNVVDGALLLTPDEVVATPRHLEDIYAGRWAEMPPDVQHVLTLASSLTPARLDAGVADELRALVPMLVELARQSGIGQVDALLRRAQDEFAWIHLTHDTLVEFQEPVLSQIAWQHSSDNEASGLRDRAIPVATTYLLQHRDSIRSEASALLSNELYIAFARDGHLPLDVFAVASATNAAAVLASLDNLALRH